MSKLTSCFARPLLYGTTLFCNRGSALEPLPTVASRKLKANLQENHEMAATSTSEEQVKKIKKCCVKCTRRVMDTSAVAGTKDSDSIGTTQQSSMQKSVTVRQASVPKTFYRRPLPDSCIAFASEEGKQIFREALMTGHMNCYFKLASQFRTQDEPAYCGLATLIMVLNALEVDPGRVWKGPWKWYHEEMLDCCISTEIIRKEGITFEEFGCLADCNSLDTLSARIDDSSSEENFRSLVKSLTLKENEFLVVSYSRPVLGQTGDGHFAPVSGYHPDRDLVLILDTARFKYPPHWVSLPLLFHSMKALDKTTGLPRGYIQLWSAKDSKMLLVFKAAEQFSVNMNQQHLQSYRQFLSSWAQLMAVSLSPSDAEDLTSVISQSLQGLVKISSTFHRMCVLGAQEHITCTDSCGIHCVPQVLLSELETTAMFQVVGDKIGEMSAEDIQQLEKLFGTRPNEYVCVPGKASNQAQQLEASSDSKPSCVNMNLELHLSHFVTMFLLSWPYSYCPAALTVESSLQAFSQQAQQESHGKFLNDEIMTLSRQLKKLTHYHVQDGPTSLPQASVCCPKEK